MVKNLLTMRAIWIQSPGGEEPLEKEMATSPVFFVRRIPWTEEPTGYSPSGSKESDTTEGLPQLLHRIPVSWGGATWLFIHFSPGHETGCPCHIDRDWDWYRWMAKHCTIFFPTEINMYSYSAAGDHWDFMVNYGSKEIWMQLLYKQENVGSKIFRTQIIDVCCCCYF